MNVDNTKKQYNLSREAASRLLKVSLRTLDRYVKGKKMSSQIVNGRIWLNREEIEEFRVGRDRGVTIDKVDMSIQEMSIDNRVDRVDNVDKASQEKFTSRPKLNNQNSDRILIERLIIANYRVGQLEAQIRNSIPMIDYHKENSQRVEIENELREKISKYKRLAKRIFIILLFIFLALQPLWIIYFFAR